MTKYMRRGANREGLLDLIELLPAGELLVEVGSYAGESLELFARSGKWQEIHVVDSWRFEGSGAVESRFDETLQRLIADGYRVTKHRGDSRDVAARFQGEADFVYIDASHVYQNVRADLAAWLPHVRQQGWIGGHDYCWNFPGVLRAVFEEFGKPYRVFQDSSWVVRLDR